MMNIISWNSRGLNSQSKQRILKRKMQKYSPEIVFLQETKCNKISIDSLRLKLGRYYEVLEVESQGRVGGLATVCDSRKIHLLSAEAYKHFIALEVQPSGNSSSFLCINTYSPQKLEDKINFLLSLSKLLARQPNSNCILGGIST